MKIYKQKYYIMREHPGISGFQQWDKWDYRVVTGFKAANHKSSVIRQFFANGRGRFRLEDGHTPEHQPIVKEVDIYDWLDKERYQAAFILNPEVYGLETVKEPKQS